MPEATQHDVRRHVTAEESVSTATDPKTGVSPALQVICLGSGGGPSEDNVTGFLVRSLDSGWTKGSLLAVDAGSHLAAITRILERSFPLYSNVASSTDSRKASVPAGNLPQSMKTTLTDGPVAGVEFRNESARANALELLHTYISCYLITHPHLDHLSGLAINTAALHGRSRPKTLAALPSTVDAVKRHIFNDVIWPNLSDEDGGVGFVSYQRLKEGGDHMIGEGESRGYINVVDGLAVRAFSISHGVCTSGPPRHQSRASIAAGLDLSAALSGRASTEPTTKNRSTSMADYGTSMPSTPSAHRQSMHNILAQGHAQPHGPCIVDSTAYFVRDEETSREVLIFGDVEPDSVSLSPRNEMVWTEAAPRIANGVLRGILIECSYSDAVSDETLFGHLCPRHLIAELAVLAEMVHNHKETGTDGTKKRKRSARESIESLWCIDGSDKRSRSQTATRNASSSNRSSFDHDSARFHEGVHFSSDGEAVSPRAMVARSVSAVPHFLLTSHKTSTPRASIVPWDEPPLAGLTVVIIHVKDTFKDGPPVSETILTQLVEHGEALRSAGRPLGCKFVISKRGDSYWF